MVINDRNKKKGQILLAQVNFKFSRWKVINDFYLNHKNTKYSDSNFYYLGINKNYIITVY